MAVSPSDVLKLGEQNGAKFFDIRFSDLPGLMQHFTIPFEEVSEDAFEEGFGFDGSSIRGFQEIQESDMILVPDPDTAVMDPFAKYPTLVIHAFVKDPLTGEFYSRDPRYIARKAEDYLKGTGIADVAYFGPEAEFYIFDSIRFDQNHHEGYYHIDAVEGVWNSGAEEGGKNLGYKPRYKEGYFPVPPMDHYQDLRSEMVLTLRELGIPVEVHHHEVGTAGQAEIDMGFAPLLQVADRLMLYKYVIKNTGLRHHKTITFMPKPIFQDNGSGMHVHQSLWKDGRAVVLGRARLRAAIRHGALVHRGHPRARTRVARPLRADDELVQASGPRLRGAREPRLLAAEPVGRGTHTALLEITQSEADGVPLPRPVVEPVPRVPGDVDGRP